MTQPYHYQNSYVPVLIFCRDGIFRKSIWRVQNRDGLYGTFTSSWLFHRLQWYYGTAKCDGSESHKIYPRIDMTDEPKELRAFRWRRNGPGELKWDNMGGS